ncbi:MAG: Sir2 family NAD-dependent protein deacetylase [Desulfarculaceae bacterium]|nr:Sir2 family NAD-dependent protein deacetylase [Desulfarculaceae bacterium]MCF8071780.1 Sir2 family NAD-dependent protein deacetylase [Desulfarculaceae bacterium]MCF8101330.1 Sir2 family NAD-dependent protein deacetylase [Desulfarculaceae bacterium]MCF8117289.1 Sir2 family NAD-dependent protein deacetylase [Desulfarculaceae bacterium]
MDQKIMDLARLVEQGRGLVVFSGAGMSTESGIPDYRSPGGIWERHRPVMYPEFKAHAWAREDYWRFYQEWFPGFGQAAPNAGHRALGRLHAAGLLRGVVTQNVDGLHQAGGVPSSAVVEVHGNVFDTACLNGCGHQEPTAEVLERFTRGDKDPACPGCGGVLKPTTISFGQNLDPTALERAAQLCASANPLIVVGSSLVVTPAAELPLAALAAGGALAILNRDPTPLDERAALLFRRPAGEALDALAGALLKN